MFRTDFEKLYYCIIYSTVFNSRIEIILLYLKLISNNKKKPGHFLLIE